MGRLLVDGYNVIRRDPALHELESQSPILGRAALLRLLNHGALSRYEVWAVFDGTPPAGERLSPGRVKVLHSRSQTADSLIAHVCSSQDVVVTDDLGLAAETLRAGPQVWSVRKLIEKVRPVAVRRRGPASSAEKPLVPRPPRLRGFDVCPRCMFSDRDDWIMLCEEDSNLRRPKNFREGW